MPEKLHPFSPDEHVRLLDTDVFTEPDPNKPWVIFVDDDLNALWRLPDLGEWPYNLTLVWINTTGLPPEPTPQQIQALAEYVMRMRMQAIAVVADKNYNYIEESDRALNFDGRAFLEAFKRWAGVVLLSGEYPTDQGRGFCDEMVTKPANMAIIRYAIECALKDFAQRNPV